MKYDDNIRNECDDKHCFGQCQARAMEGTYHSCMGMYPFPYEPIRCFLLTSHVNVDLIYHS